ncbi:exocyst subunit exo70 family protein F1 [Rhynchospora pubera]|uniref:Exocyst subunit Exo70 family protein n=1 Tax=Rhynchospora pubera TaxID=906938 RepID=A0AAV8FCH6_9POAL|nr:exocyst subunit exo70 family protein F1 [Rhynchospora pubera]KAJ4790948.1 exocyst subunit exo70 family protein F1 [Rhynchospora pubera]KAJ4814772.1 exocyst subunit exo70 family protein F1 [Rhynchospora pubera]
MSSAPAAGVDGQEKVIAAAQHIVKSLATSKNAADDMIRILSRFDHRLSSLYPDSPDTPNMDPSSSSPSSSADALKAILAQLEAAEKVVMQWDSSDSLLFESSSDVILQYFASVDDLIAISATSSSLSAEDGYDIHLRAENVLQLAMSRLEEELHPLLIRNTVSLDATGLSCSLRRLSLSFPSSEADFDTSSEFDPADTATPTSSLAPNTPHHPLLEDPSLDLIRHEAISDLRDIADRMIRAGYAKELVQVYCSIRKDVIDECLSILGVERLSIDEVQHMEWRLLDEKMKKWIQGVKIVIRGLLSGERRLCENIFASSEEIQEECFIEITKGCVLQLLNFGDAVAIIPRSAEKLFRIIDMYEVVKNEVLRELRILYPGELGSSIYGEADGILKRLGDAVKGTLFDFGFQVQRENSRRPMQAGEIHPLTRYVMNYMRLLVVYSETLECLLGDDEGFTLDTINTDDDTESLGSMTPYGRRLYAIISYLEANLEEKSNLYEDGGLRCIFLMNNIFYIYNKVKDSELGRILGDHWLRRRRGKIRQYSKTYLRVSWTKVLSYLRDDSLSGGSSGSSGHSSKVALREKFRNFNVAFEEIHRVQTTWKVPDPQMREEIKISISEQVIPAYRAFVGRYGPQVDGGRHSNRYIKYSTEDLESHLSELFEGLSGVPNHSRRRA